LKGAILGVISRAWDLFRSLGINRVPVYLIDDRLNVGRFSKYCKKYIQIDSENYEKNLMKCLVELAEEARGWMLLPMGDDHVGIIAKNRNTLMRYYELPTKEWDLLEYFYDKTFNYQLASRLNIPIPKTFYPQGEADLEALEQEIGYPVLLKPAIVHKLYMKTHIQLGSHP